MTGAEPVCTIIGGPNGAGKTTFGLQYLRDVGPSPRFVNADLIAAGLSPLSPEKEWLAASRLFLSEIEASILERKDFAFETTLAGRGHLHLIHRLRHEGWQIRLIYLWLPNVSMAVERVRERVRHGGHDIPDPVIARRFVRGLRHMLDDYAPICDLTICLDNSRSPPGPIFVRSAAGLEIDDPRLFQQLEAMR